MQKRPFASRFAKSARSWFVFLACLAVAPVALAQQAPQLEKVFESDPVTPGGTTTLRFTLSNLFDNDASGIAFTDDLDATLSGLVASGLPQGDVCGVGSQISGTSILSFSGGSLPAGQACSFTVTLQVPAGAAAGSYANTTSQVSASVNGAPVTSNPASDTLLVSSLLFSKAFIGDPAFAGGSVTLRFTIDNTASSANATALAFTDDLDAVLSGLVATGLPQSDLCGAGSALAGTNLLTFSGGSVAAGASCSFDVTLAVPASAAVGEYTNLTSTLAASLDGTPAILPAAADSLSVVEVMSLAKSFIDDPVAAGDTATLRFTLSNASAAAPVTGVAFTDDLNSVLTGLAATGYANNTCTGATIAGTNTISFSGGTIPAGGSCSFDATVPVPGGAAPGTYANATSAVTGTWQGNPVSAAPATDSLAVRALNFSKGFDGPAQPGGTQTLRFTIGNLDAGSGVIGIAFSDNLDNVLTGLAAVGLPTSDVCGVGSSLSGGSSIVLSNGSLPAGGSCEFTVTVQVPQEAATGSYQNTTSTLFLNGLDAAPPATATLLVAELPGFAKAFAPQPIGAGGVSTLTFTIDNAANTDGVASLAFADTLPAGVSIATLPNAATTCAGGSLVASAGGATVSYSGGSLAGGATCTVSVDVTSAVPGSHVNTSGNLTSSFGNSGTATATLAVSSLPVFSLAFTPGQVFAGAVSILTFTLDHSSGIAPAAALAFTDTLPTNLVVAAVPNAANTCDGSFVAVPGAGVVSLSGGSLAAGASCTLSVAVSSATPGLYLNVSGDLTSSLGNSGPASGQLGVGLASIPVLGWPGLALLAALLAAYALRRLGRAP